MSLILFTPKGFNPNRKPMTMEDRSRIIRMSLTICISNAMFLAMGIAIGSLSGLPKMAIDLLFWTKLTSSLGIVLSIILIGIMRFSK